MCKKKKQVHLLYPIIVMIKLNAILKQKPVHFPFDFMLSINVTKTNITTSSNDNQQYVALT